jgi:hypothetical protein
MCIRALNLWVFRESRRLLDGTKAKSELLHELRSLSAQSSPDELTAVLLRAGELECGVADNGNAGVEPWMTLSDSLAEALVLPEVPMNGAAAGLAGILQQARVPERIEVSPPEGFAYYALHPLAYAEVLRNIPRLREPLAVVGIRSIGTTLSAVVVAAARARGLRAERITVRPGGHPYNRRTTFSQVQIEFVRRHLQTGSTFLVIDEGPGLSGSSFLSVAEALESAGVAREDIVLVCSHAPAFSEFRADNGAQRAQRFRWNPLPAKPQITSDARDFIGGGEWRKHLFDRTEDWPASWVSFERLKYLSKLSNGESRFFKFAGFGQYGEAALQREEQVAHAGFGPMPRRETGGFASYSWIAGRPMSADDLSNEAIEALASYCAFRARTFSAGEADIDTLQGMAEHNLSQREMSLPFRLRLERPVLADGRMSPHEWLLTASGRMLKTDSGSHGDDHFFPGPTDIAWDLAGAIVEWRMTGAQSRYFLERYRAASGDEASTRVSDFVIAYSGFRCAYCLMAANALQGSEEQKRFELAAANYQAVLLQLVEESLVRR